MYRIPKNIFVLIIAKTSRAPANFLDKIWVMVKTLTKNIKKYSIVKKFNADVIIKNHKQSPAVTANALNRGCDKSILNRID